MGLARMLLPLVLIGGAHQFAKIQVKVFDLTTDQANHPAHGTMRIFEMDHVLREPIVRQNFNIGPTYNIVGLEWQCEQYDGLMDPSYFLGAVKPHTLDNTLLPPSDTPAC